MLLDQEISLDGAHGAAEAVTGGPPQHRPLRIAQMLESDGPGGAEIVVLQLSQELRRQGHHVLYVGPSNGCGWLRERFVEDGFETDQFVLRRPLDYRCVQGMREMLRKHRIDVVHSHEFTMAVYGAAAASRLGIPHVTTMHGNQKMLLRLRRRMALRWAFRRTSLAVACSDATRVDVETGLGLPAGRMHTVRNGVPHVPGERVPVRRELGIREDELLIVCVGNVVPRKGHIQLLRAMALLEDQGKHYPWRVAIAGDRRDAAPAIDDFVAERGWTDRVHLLGVRSDVNNILAAADIFSMPSLWEGLPLAVLEAMFAGLPIVATSASGIPEAIVAGESGLLAEPTDVNALAQHFDLLLRSGDERRRLGQNARARAEAEFSVGRMAQRYLAAYRGVRV